MSEDNRKQDCDAEPVKYCARCLSLKVKYEECVDFEYCADCGSSDILEASFEQWEKMYENKYGHKFVQKEIDPTKSYIFKLSVEELKSRVYTSDKWREIIRTIYPNFPGCYGKADSVILFFHTIVKQNRLDELKLLLYKQFKF